MLKTAASFTSADVMFDRIGVGLLVVHGSTVIRASSVAATLLRREPKSLVGRDLFQLFSLEPLEQFKAWLVRAYVDPDAAGELCVSLLGAEENSDPTPFKLLAGVVEGGSASTRLIAFNKIVVAEAAVDHGAELRRTLRELLDGNPVPTFLISADHVIMHWNRACESAFGFSAKDMIGTRKQWQPFYETERFVLADLIVNGTSFEEAEELYPGRLRVSTVLSDGFECSQYFPKLGENGVWLLFTAAPIRNVHGGIMGAIQTLVDISEIKLAEAALLKSQSALEDIVEERTFELIAAKKELEVDIAKREEAEHSLLTRYAEMTELNLKLADANEQIQEAQNQLVQSEKLASIGQLAAGVAHEINNPIGYVFSNFGSLDGYIADMLKLIAAYREVEAQIGDAVIQTRLKRLREQLDIDFLQEDAKSLMNESRDGIERVRKIVQDLKDFSHVDASAEWQFADIRRGLESTLNIVNNELKYHVEVVRELNDIPQVECFPSQLNQVFMNLLVNAGHALEGRAGARIIVRTGADDKEAWVEVIDNGCGMSEATLSRIFDPFFTTKAIGRGTGLGLSLSYGIVQKHGGRLEVSSVLDQGTTFRMVLPLKQTAVLLPESLDVKDAA